MSSTYLSLPFEVDLDAFIIVIIHGRSTLNVQPDSTITSDRHGITLLAILHARPDARQEGIAGTIAFPETLSHIATIPTRC